MTTGPDALRATDVSLAYGKERIVHGASISLVPGCVTALVGPNGSGKSTLLRGLTALHRPTGGSVVFADGADASSLGERELARRIAMLAQSHPDPSGVSVREVVAYGRFAHRGRFRAADPHGDDAIERAMSATGVAELATHPVSQLSGGQRQRVWLATCLAQQTGIVLLDEPTTYLDLRYQREILEIVRELADDPVSQLSGGQRQRVWLATCLAQQTGIVLLDEPTTYLDLRYQREILEIVRELADAGVAVGIVLHDLEQAAEIADRVVLLVHGRIAADGSPREVLTPERLSAAYEVPIDVEAVADGLRIRPRRIRRQPAVSRAA